MYIRTRWLGARRSYTSQQRAWPAARRRGARAAGPRCTSPAAGAVAAASSRARAAAPGTATRTPARTPLYGDKHVSNLVTIQVPT